MSGFVPGMPASDDMIARVTSAIDDVQNSIGYVREYANEMRDLLETALEDMDDLVGTYDPNLEDIDTSMPTLDSPSMPSTPIFGELPIDWTFPDSPIAPTLLDYGEMDFEFVSPTPPDEISSNFDWTASVYTSDMWLVLFNKTHSDILDGGTGLTDDVYNAIISREQNARRLNQDKEHSRLVDTAGTSGFNLASGHIAAILRDVVTENGVKDQDALNNLAIKDFELAQQNSQFAVTSGIELEKLARTAFDEAEKLGFEAQKAVNEFLIAVYEANVKMYIARWDGIKLELEAKLAKINAVTEMNDGLNKSFIAKTEIYRAQIDAIKSKNIGLIETRKGEIDVYRAEIDAVSTQYSLLISEMKANVDRMQVEAELTIKEEELKLLAYDSKIKLADGINQAKANIGAQAVASALGAINTTMSESYSGSDSIEHKGTAEWISQEVIDNS